VGGKDGKERGVEGTGRDRKMKEKRKEKDGRRGKEEKGGKDERGGRKWSPHLSECGYASATRPEIGGVWTPWTPMN